MKSSLIRPLLLASSFVVVGPLQAAITFSYDTDQLTISVDEAFDFTLTAEAPTEIFLVFDNLYSTDQTPFTTSPSTGDLVLSGTTNSIDNSFRNGENTGSIDRKDLYLRFDDFSSSPGSNGSVLSLQTGSSTSDPASPPSFTFISEPDNIGATVSVFLTDNTGLRISEIETVAVPEPGMTAALIGLLGGAFVLARRSRKNRR